MARPKLTLRFIGAAELDVADEIVRDGFQSTDSFLPDLRRYHAIQPDGFLLAIGPDGPVGVCDAIDYGQFAYIGPTAVRKSAQASGIGREMLLYLLDWLERRGTTLVALDSTEAGKRLYSTCGFVDVGPGETHVLEAPRLVEPRRSDRIRLATPSDLHRLVEFDAPFFGAHRPTVLAALMADFPDRFLILEGSNGAIAGYACAQSKRVGPWIARNDDDAAALLDRALEFPFPKAPSIAVTARNPRTLRLIEPRGFRLTLRTPHMIRGGTALPGHRDSLLSQASFATG